MKKKNTQASFHPQCSHLLFEFGLSKQTRFKRMTNVIGSILKVGFYTMWQLSIPLTLAPTLVSTSTFWCVSATKKRFSSKKHTQIMKWLFMVLNGELSASFQHSKSITLNGVIFPTFVRYYTTHNMLIQVAHEKKRE